MLSMEKVCTKCSLKKDLLLFPAKKKAKDGHASGVGRVLRRIGMCGIVKITSIIEIVITRVAEKFVSKMHEKSLII